MFTSTIYNHISTNNSKQGWEDSDKHWHQTLSSYNILLSKSKDLWVRGPTCANIYTISWWTFDPSGILCWQRTNAAVYICRQCDRTHLPHYVVSLYAAPDVTINPLPLWCHNEFLSISKDRSVCMFPIKMIIWVIWNIEMCCCWFLLLLNSQIQFQFEIHFLIWKLWIS